MGKDMFGSKTPNLNLNLLLKKYLKLVICKILNIVFIVAALLLN